MIGERAVSHYIHGGLKDDSNEINKYYHRTLICVRKRGQHASLERKSQPPGVATAAKRGKQTEVIIHKAVF